MDWTTQDLAEITRWLAGLRDATAKGRAERPADAPVLSADQKICREAIFLLCDRMSEMEFDSPDSTGKLVRMAKAVMVLIAVHDGSEIPEAVRQPEATGTVSDPKLLVQ